MGQGVGQPLPPAFFGDFLIYMYISDIKCKGRDQNNWNLFVNFHVEGTPPPEKNSSRARGLYSKFSWKKNVITLYPKIRNSLDNLGCRVHCL